MTAKFELKMTSSLCLRKLKKISLHLFTTNKWRTRQIWKNLGLVENWVRSMGFTDRLCEKKWKEIRICADFSTGLNAALKDYHYPLPSTEEIFAKLNGGRFFSKIDLSDTYLQIPVEEEFSKLLCINTHWGLHKFGRLPFSVKVAPTIFQQIMDTMLSDLDFVVAYLDDILMNSQNVE